MTNTNSNSTQRTLMESLASAIELNSPIEGEPDDSLLFPNVVSANLEQIAASEGKLALRVRLSDGSTAIIQAEIYG